MRLGHTLPQFGSFAGPEALVTVAKAAEDMGYDSLWVLDRVLWPINPKAPYPATPDGSLPDGYKRVIDPVGALTFAAAHTKRVRLGTSILNIPWYNPVLFARQLASLDVLSGGRLEAGFGMGWSPDEFEAVGQPMKNRGKRADEFLQVLKKIWTEDPVEFEGKYYRVAKSIVGLKPVQKPHPPIYMAAYTPGAMGRTARFADGWNPAGIPVDGMEQMFNGMKKSVQEAGRDPSAFKLVVRANLYITDKPLGDDRFIFTGTLDQIGADVTASRKLGAHEVTLDPLFSPGVDSVDKILSLMEQLWNVAHKS